MFALTPSLRKIISVVTYGYFGLPILLFLWNWFTPWVSVPLIVLLPSAIYFAWREEPEVSGIAISKRSLLLTILLVLGWCALSGIGGYAFQNGDHHFRNAVFHDLVHYSWPVQFHHPEGDALLVYYFTYWLPAATVAKIAGMQVGSFILYLWTVLGILLLLCPMAIYLRKGSLVIPLGLILFSSGCDILPFFIQQRLTHEPFVFGQHFEWWVRPFQYASPTSCLYWVFNQAVPAWIGTALLMNQRSYCTKFFIAALVLPFAPFGFIGLMLLMGMTFLLELTRGQKPDFFQSASTGLQAWGRGYMVAVALLLAFVTGAFFSTTGRGLHLYIMGGLSLREALFSIPLFLVLDFAIMAVFIFLLTQRDKKYLYAALAILLLMPFFQIISVMDFVMRVSIPAILVLTIYACGIFIDGFASRPKALRNAFIAFSLVCALTPLSEIFRSVAKTAKCIYLSKSFIADNVKTLANPPEYAKGEYIDSLLSTNFQKSFYWKHLRP